MDVGYILIPLLVGLISAFLGYLIGKSNRKTITIVDTSRNDSLRLELEKCRKESATLTNEINDLELALSKAGAPPNAVTHETANLISFDAESAFAVFNKKITANDLKIVEGIEPAIEALFHNAGIKTWKQLAETPVASCQEILDHGGDKFTIHNPATWPKQSELAYQGEWAALKKWQNDLNGSL